MMMMTRVPLPAVLLERESDLSRPRLQGAGAPSGQPLSILKSILDEEKLFRRDGAIVPVFPRLVGRMSEVLQDVQ
jgi:hypothetical protein